MIAANAASEHKIRLKARLGGGDSPPVPVRRHKTFQGPVTIYRLGGGGGGFRAKQGEI